MVLYTTVPLEEIFKNADEEIKDSNVQIPYSRGVIEVEFTSLSTAKIVRIISNNIYDYLEPELQPGSELKFQLKADIKD